MSYLAQFLKVIPEAAAGPYSLIAYLFTLSIWGFLSYRVVRNKNLLNKLSNIPQKDRADLVMREMGTPLPPTLTAEQWIRIRNHNALLISFFLLVLCLTVIIIVAVTKVNEKSEVLKREAETAFQVRRGQLLVNKYEFFVEIDFDLTTQANKLLLSKYAEYTKHVSLKGNEMSLIKDHGLTIVNVVDVRGREINNIEIKFGSPLYPSEHDPNFLIMSNDIHVVISGDNIDTESKSLSDLEFRVYAFDAGSRALL